MEKYFRTQQGELVNIVTHTLEQLKKWPNLKVYIGTDSQVYRPFIRYVTAIVYKYGTRGAHYIYHCDHIGMGKRRDDFTRLYEEGNRTILTSHLLTDEIPIAIENLEFDFANVKKTLSTPLVAAFKGYQGAKFKGGDMYSTKAADHICRHYFDTIVPGWIDKEERVKERERLVIR